MPPRPPLPQSSGTRQCLAPSLLLVQAEYRKLIEGMGNAEWRNEDARAVYLFGKGLEADQVQVFEARMKIQIRTGANQYFLGRNIPKSPHT